MIKNDQSIAIAGFGQEGKSALEYYKNLGFRDVQVFDESKGDDFLTIPDSSLIIRSPGIKIDKFKISSNLWSSTNEFFEKCPALIIGVTGSKGKGTTASFIYSILIQFENQNNIGKIHLLGNIGTPALEKLPEINQNDIVIYELSSFQLWDLKKSPHISIITNFEPDHLDVHSNLEEYYNSKLNIIKYQKENDYYIINSQESLVFELVNSLESKSKFIDSASLRLDEYSKIKESVLLPGLHNISNAVQATFAAKIILEEFGVNFESSFNQIIKGIENFKGLKNRLEKVGEFNKIEFYNDSIATTPGSVIAAINSFDKPIVLILGGYDKGADYSVLIDPINNSEVFKIILFGKNASKIKQQIEQNINLEIIEVDYKTNSLNKVVDLANSLFKDSNFEEGVVLFSPAAASFDQFKNYKERGSSFRTAVERLRYLIKPKPKLVVFDSGKGGRFFANQISEQFDNEIIVLDDVQNVPYGEKSADEVFELTKAKLLAFLEVGEVIVIACNTATALAIEKLRVNYPRQLFIGFEPMVKTAANFSKTKQIVILATPATLSSKRYLKLKEKFATNYKVFEPDCKDWAELIEKNEFKGEQSAVHLAELKQILINNDVDIIVLACTHYLWIKDELNSILKSISKENVKILEPTDAINQRIKSFLDF